MEEKAAGAFVSLSGRSEEAEKVSLLGLPLGGDLLTARLGTEKCGREDSWSLRRVPVRPAIVRAVPLAEPFRDKKWDSKAACEQSDKKREGRSFGAGEKRPSFE